MTDRFKEKYNDVIDTLKGMGSWKGIGIVFLVLFMYIVIGGIKITIDVKLLTPYKNYITTKVSIPTK